MGSRITKRKRLHLWWKRTWVGYIWRNCLAYPVLHTTRRMDPYDKTSHNHYFY